MKRLGDYIRPVDVRNRDLKVTRLMGINIEKRFMPSVANVVGTDLSNYKVVLKGQFACNLMHVGRDEKIPVALQKDDEPIIVSPAYVVFEVVDTNVLLTEYLMMWFSRSEFDRNAWFYTDGDVRGGMDRDALFDMQIPVPAIEKQRETVAEYNTLATRIETNKKLIATLEQTAQTLYRHTFIDNIDPNNLPDGWRMGTIGEFCDIITGKKDVNESLDIGLYRFFSCSPDTFFSNEYIACGPAALIAGNGSYTGRVTYYDKEFDLYQRTYACLPKENVRELMPFLYSVLRFQFQDKFMGGSRGSSIPYIVRGDIADFGFLFQKEVCEKFSKYMLQYLTHIQFKTIENQTLTQMQTLLLSKMGA